MYVENDQGAATFIGISKTLLAASTRCLLHLSSICSVGLKDTLMVNDSPACSAPGLVIAEAGAFGYGALPGLRFRLQCMFR
jgi:hypothetical protein